MDGSFFISRPLRTKDVGRCVVTSANVFGRRREGRRDWRDESYSTHQTRQTNKMHPGSVEKIAIQKSAIKEGTFLLVGRQLILTCKRLNFVRIAPSSFLSLLYLM